MFAVRIVTADYYLASPIKELDVCYSEFRESDVKKVPVVRIFGATPAGKSNLVFILVVFTALLKVMVAVLPGVGARGIVVAAVLTRVHLYTSIMYCLEEIRRADLQHDDRKTIQGVDILYLRGVLRCCCAHELPAAVVVLRRSLLIRLRFVFTPILHNGMVVAGTSGLGVRLAPLPATCGLRVQLSSAL